MLGAWSHVLPQSQCLLSGSFYIIPKFLFEAEMSQKCQQPITTSRDLTCRTKAPHPPLPSIWILPGPAFLGEVYLTSCHHCLVTEERSWDWSWISRCLHEEEPLNLSLPVSDGSPASHEFSTNRVCLTNRSPLENYACFAFPKQL